MIMILQTVSRSARMHRSLLRAYGLRGQLQRGEQGLQHAYPQTGSASLRSRFCLDHTAGGNEGDSVQNFIRNTAWENSVCIRHSVMEQDENGRAEIVPITNIAHVKLSDLVGYEIPETEADGQYRSVCTTAKRRTTAFSMAMREPAKSSSIKAHCQRIL